MEEEVIAIQDGEVTSYIHINGDTPLLTQFTAQVLNEIASTSDGQITFLGTQTAPEGAEAQDLLDFVYSFDDSPLTGGSAENIFATQLGEFGLDFADYFDLSSDIEDGSIFTGSGGGGGGSSSGGGGSSGGGTRTGLTADQIDFDALAREGERLEIEAARLGVTGAEIAALQGLNAEDRALIEEQFDLQREEAQRAYVVQSDPARGVANALAGGNFKSGVNGFAQRVRRLTQETGIDQIENSRNRSLNSNSQQAVRLNASAQRNALDGQELGLAQDAFNDQLAEIAALPNIANVVGGSGQFGEQVLGGLGLGGT